MIRSFRPLRLSSSGPPETDPVLKRLREIDLLHLTPLQALQILAELADQARRDG